MRHLTCCVRCSVVPSNSSLLTTTLFSSARTTLVYKDTEYSSLSWRYEACPESKDTSRVGRWGNFLCLLWQHCRRPWSFTCEPWSFESDRTGFIWVRRVWNGSAGQKSRLMRGAFRHTISQCKRWTSSGNSQTNCCCLW